MGGFVVRRLARMVLVLLGVSIVTFMLVRVGGDPALVLAPLNATQAELQQVRENYGLTDPLPIQFGRFLGGLGRGDLGRSLRSGQPALELVMERVPATLELAGAALLLALALAFPLGIAAARSPNSPLDRASMLFGLIGQSMPVYWLGLLLILIFAVNLRWLPYGGRGGLESLIMPALTLALFNTARTARMLRSSLLEVLGNEFIRTARAKGLSEEAVVWRHALRNALLPVVTLVGLDAAALLAGAVITETVFAWPGIGRLAISAIQGRDYPVVQAVVFVVACMYVLINAGVDVLYGLLNPRVRLA